MSWVANECVRSILLHVRITLIPSGLDGVELMIIILGAFAQAISANGHAVNIFGVLIVWRFLVSPSSSNHHPPPHHSLTCIQMGIGIGGDYPLSAVISSEFASTRIRGRMMTAVFAFQGWGNFAAALVGLIVVLCYKTSILSDTPPYYDHVDETWRILIGLGCVPGVIALYFRLTIPETPRFTMDIERNLAQAASDIENVLTTGQASRDPDAIIQRVQAPKAGWKDFGRHFSQMKNFKVLFGAAYSWFALDVSSLEPRVFAIH